VFRLVLFFFFIFSLCVLCSCGGGTSAGAAAANASNSSSVANTNTGTASGSGATTVISTDTLTVAQFWNENVSTAYASSGQISGYVYKDFPYSKLDSAVLSIDKISGKTTLKIRHENHGAANGDLVTI
jgi:hypothetical protein